MACILGLFRVCIADLVKHENKEHKLIKEEVDQLNGIVKEALADSETLFFCCGNRWTNRWDDSAKESKSTNL